jgi:hypothetical protein
MHTASNKRLVLGDYVPGLRPCQENKTNGTQKPPKYTFFYFGGAPGETAGAAEDQRRKGTQIEPGAQAAEPSQNHQVLAFLFADHPLGGAGAFQNA